MDDGRIGSSPLRESGAGVRRGVSKRDIGDNREDGVAELCVIWLKRALHVENESGCDRGEQTSLFRKSQINTANRVNKKRENPHEYQGGVQVFVIFFDKVVVVVVSFALKLVIELNARAVVRSKEMWKEGGKCFEHSVLQTGNDRRNQQRFGGE